MKRKALIALALLVVATLLVGCGGVSQEEYDAAVADKEAAQAQVTSLQSQLSKAQSDLAAANTAKTEAEADLATCESSLTKANSDLTAARSSLSAAQAEVADLEAQVADLEAQLAECQAGGGGDGGGEEEPPPSGGFTGTEYSNTEFGFSFQYPDFWTAATTLPQYVVAKYGAAPYNLPTAFVGVMDQSAYADLEAAFDVYAEANSYLPVVSFTATSVTIGSVACTKAEVVYTSAYGEIKGTIIGFTKNNKWVFIGAVTIDALGAWENETQKDDIIGTITFQ